MAKALMIQGTSSGAGKSLITAALCRIFADRGMRVAPFKSQNMALNSFVTLEGAEIGRAQALQAEAARVTPTADMNPVLLKTAGERGCQVIINGRVHSTMKAREYYTLRDSVWPHAAAAYDRLAAAYDLVLIEGAGSPAEINLNEVEIVNMRVARHANCPVLLVGDIDKGGVFASFYGTVGLMEGDSALIKGFVVNKFRGDMEILRPGLDIIKARTGVPVVGVLPYMQELGLEEEDGLHLAGHATSSFASERLRIVVLRLNSISNFTDFVPFMYEPDVDLVFSTNRSDLAHADLIVIPGSKNTVRDLQALRASGVDGLVAHAANTGTPIVGVCGGYQMLGHRILDPHCVESDSKEVAGLGLLNVVTEFVGSKLTSQTEAATSMFGGIRDMHGYEIHMGRTTGDVGLFNLKRLSGGVQERELADGSSNGSVWGTYLHGVFDNDAFRHALLNGLRPRRGMREIDEPVRFNAIKQKRLDRWAAFVSDNLDMRYIESLIR